MDACERRGGHGSRAKQPRRILSRRAGVGKKSVAAFAEKTERGLRGRDRRRQHQRARGRRARHRGRGPHVDRRRQGRSSCWLTTGPLLAGWLAGGAFTAAGRRGGAPTSASVEADAAAYRRTADRVKPRASSSAGPAAGSRAGQRMGRLAALDKSSRLVSAIDCPHRQP